MWKSGAECQPDLETLFDVKFNPCGGHTSHHGQQLNQHVGWSTTLTLQMVE